MARAHRLDARDLAPPEPLERVLALLPTLGPGEYVHMSLRREPYPLYALLPDLGFVHRATVSAEGPCEVRIWRAGDREAESAVLHAERAP